MENRFEKNLPEEQGWGAYLSPPPLPGQSQNFQADGTQRTLCSRVQEMLPSLLENDGDIRPEMASAIYGHLGICTACSREFNEMQRLVAMVEALAPPDMPMDFSGIIMQRIQTHIGPLHDGVPARPLRAAPSLESTGENVVSAPLKSTDARQKSSVTTKQTETTVQQAQQTAAQIVQTTQQTTLQTETHHIQRILLSGVLMTVLAFFLTQMWGRQMLGVNLQVADAWLEQIVGTLKRVPVLGTIAELIFATLRQVGDGLAETYRILGATAVRGLAMDVALCVAGYYFLVSRRRRGPLSGIQGG